MFRTRVWLPWLGLMCLVVLSSACGAAGDDSGRMPLVGASAGASGSSVLPVAQSGAGSVAGAGPVVAGRPAVAGTPAVPSAAAGSGVSLTPGPAGNGAGAPGVAGMSGVAGMAGGRGPAGMGAAGAAGMSGAAGVSSAAGAGGTMAASGETGRMLGMTAAHNAVRAMVMTTPPLPPLTWSPTLATYAQEWADSLAKTQCNRPMHRSQQDLRSKGYGENLAAAGGVPAPMTTAKWATDGWAGEVKCWTYGTIGAELGGTEKCDMACYQQMRSDGCGHYTQIVWRATTQLGCGVASCQSGGATWDIWICNYGPPGNVVGQKPY